MLLCRLCMNWVLWWGWSLHWEGGFQELCVICEKLTIYRVVSYDIGERRSVQDEENGPHYWALRHTVHELWWWRSDEDELLTEVCGNRRVGKCKDPQTYVCDNHRVQSRFRLHDPPLTSLMNILDNIISMHRFIKHTSGWRRNPHNNRHSYLSQHVHSYTVPSSTSRSSVKVVAEVWSSSQTFGGVLYRPDHVKGL